MTVQLERPGADGSGGPRGGPGAEPAALRSPLVSGAVAAVWAAVLGLALVGIPVLVAWLLAPHGGSSPTDAMRAGTLAWLQAHHGTLTTGSGPLTLVPLGLALLPAVLLYRAGRWAGRVSVDGTAAAVATTAAMTAAYTTMTAMVAASTGTSGFSVAPASVLLGSVVVAAAAGGTGVLVGSGMSGAVVDALPEPVTAVLRSATAALAVLLGVGALLLGFSLLAHLGQVSALSTALQTGGFGGVLLLLLGLLALPSAVVWATCYAVGPGFAVGVATTVAPAGVALGPVPAFPLLGALPGTGPAAPVSLLALVAPLLAGAAAGLLLVRRPARTPALTAVWAGLAGLVSGAGLGLLAWLSAGSLGAVRMSDLGPSGLRVGLVTALEVGLVAAIVAWEGLRQEERLRSFASAARARLVRLRRRSAA